MGSTPAGRSPASEPAPRAPLRIATYNILLGGGGRWPEITELLRAIEPDVVALQETEEEGPVQRLGEELGYEVLFGRAPTPRHQSLLSRLPIADWKNHRDPAVFLRNSLEVLVPLPGDSGEVLHLHTVHLTAAFQRRGRAEPDRLRELAAVRAHAAETPGSPHLVLGDFNSLAPGDRVQATEFFARVTSWRRTGALQEAGMLGPVPAGIAALRWWQEPEAAEAGLEELPEAVRTGLPRLPWLVHPLLEVLPRRDATDAVLGALLPRSAVRSMVTAGYTDCLRAMHPRGDHFTCPSYQPAVRIDYIFADHRMAPRLTSCEVVGKTGALAELARRASDHFPLVSEFDLALKPSS